MSLAVDENLRLWRAAPARCRDRRRHRRICDYFPVLSHPDGPEGRDAERRQQQMLATRRTRCRGPGLLLSTSTRVVVCGA